MKLPRQLRNENFRFIKLRKNDKRPMEKEWVTKNNYCYDDIINHNGNIGIVGGYNNLYVLDFDSEYAYNKAKPHLPPTFICLSAGKRLPHVYYIDSTKDTPKSGKFVLNNGKTALDIIGEGKQVVTPYSKIENTLWFDGAEFDKYSYYTVKHDMPITKWSQKEAYKLLNQLFQDEGIEQRVKKQGDIKEIRRPQRAEYWEDKVDNVKSEWSVSRFFRYMGASRKGRMWDTPFGHSVNKQCVDINDRIGVWFDFNTQQGGDLITAAKLYWNCDFKEALERLENEG